MQAGEPKRQGASGQVHFSQRVQVPVPIAKKGIPSPARRAAIAPNRFLWAASILCMPSPSKGSDKTPTLWTRSPSEKEAILSRQSPREPQWGGQAQLRPYKPHTFIRHICRTSSLGMRSETKISAA